MSKKKYIFVTEVITILNEAGEKKLKEATSDGEATDEHGRTAEWYEDIGIPIPDSLVNRRPEIDEDGFMNLSPDEFTYDFQNRFIDMTDFFTAVEADEFGTIIQFNNGVTFWLEEDLFEVYARIYVSQMNWFERFKESVSLFFSRKKENNNKTEE
jgi:hypothetical protein